MEGVGDVRIVVDNIKLSEEAYELVLAAVRKAGYKAKPKRKPLSAETAEALEASGSAAGASSSHADASMSVSAWNLPFLRAQRV